MAVTIGLNKVNIIMGLVKNNIDTMEFDGEMNEKISLIQEFIYDNRAQGISRQILGSGLDSLSSKQQYIYKKFIEPLLKQRFGVCDDCGAWLDLESPFIDSLTVGEEEKVIYLCEECNFN